ncbi:MAG: glycerate kinase [Anaerolineae bacterium]|nr:glycerate kinase [Anaerolineae bacterium]
MKTIIIAPGAFKHSLSAREAAEAMARGLERSGLEGERVILPIADGGNGTLDAFLANGGERIETTVRDPLNRPTRAALGLLPDGETAVVEMALASGLELLRADELDALGASTYGTGQLLQTALERGARRIVVGMGGSATVDGGAGALQALGVRLLDAQGVDIPPGGGGLSRVTQVDSSRLDARWREVDVIIASDVTNPTIGETGAAAVFGPQKGASAEDVVILEHNLTHFFGVVREQVGVDVLAVEGGGAAGALSAGLMAFLGGRIESGVDLLLDFNGFDAHLKNAGLVLTGEGQMDAQTVYGKGPIGVARRAREQGVATVALVGGLNTDDAVLHEAGIAAVLPVIPKPMTLEAALEQAAALVEGAALRLGYLLQIQVMDRSS